MGEIVVSEIGRVAPPAERRLAAEVMAFGVAIGLAALAFSSLRHGAPTPVLAFAPPLVDVGTGKILDRFAANPMLDIRLDQPAVNSLALFAPGLDHVPALTAIVARAERQGTEAVPMQVAAVEPARALTAQSQKGQPGRVRVASAKPAPSAERAPLPPQRPEDLSAQTPAPIPAEPAGEASRFFGWNVPTEIGPASRKAFERVASLGEAVFDQRKVLKDVVSSAGAALERLTP